MAERKETSKRDEKADLSGSKNSLKVPGAASGTTDPAKQAKPSAEKLIGAFSSESDKSQNSNLPNSLSNKKLGAKKNESNSLLANKSDDTEKDECEDSNKTIVALSVKAPENLYNLLQQKTQNVMKLITDRKTETVSDNEGTFSQKPSVNKVNNQLADVKKSNESTNSRISESSHQSHRSLSERKGSSTRQDTLNDSRKAPKTGVIRGEYQSSQKSSPEKPHTHLLKRQCAIKPETTIDSESQNTVKAQNIENEMNRTNQGVNQNEKNCIDIEKNSPDIHKVIDVPEKGTYSQDSITSNITPKLDDQKKSSTLQLNESCDRKYHGRKLDKCCRKSDNYQEVCEESTQAVFKELSQIIQSNQVPEQLTKKGEILSNLFKQKLLAKLEASGNLDPKSTELAAITAARFAKWVEDILIETDNKRKHTIKDNSKLAAHDLKQVKEDNDDDEFVSATSSKESFTHKEDLSSLDMKAEKPEVVKIHEVSDLELKEKFGPMLEDKSKYELFNFIGPDKKPVEVKHLLAVESNMKVMIVKKTLSNTQWSNWIVEVGPDVKLDDVPGRDSQKKVKEIKSGEEWNLKIPGWEKWLPMLLREQNKLHGPVPILKKQCKLTESDFGVEYPTYTPSLVALGTMDSVFDGNDISFTASTQTEPSFKKKRDE